MFLWCLKLLKWLFKTFITTFIHVSVICLTIFSHLYNTVLIIKLIFDNTVQFFCFFMLFLLSSLFVYLLFPLFLHFPVHTTSGDTSNRIFITLSLQMATWVLLLAASSNERNTFVILIFGNFFNVDIRVCWDTWWSIFWLLSQWWDNRF